MVALPLSEGVVPLPPPLGGDDLGATAVAEVMIFARSVPWPIVGGGPGADRALLTMVGGGSRFPWLSATPPPPPPRLLVNSSDRAISWPLTATTALLLEFFRHLLLRVVFVADFVTGPFVPQQRDGHTSRVSFNEDE
jgi:hypothetical protein